MVKIALDQWDKNRVSGNRSIVYGFEKNNSISLPHTI